MSKQIELLSLDNYKVFLEPSEITHLQEEFYVGTTIPYCIVVTNRKIENSDEFQYYKVLESKADIKYRLRQITN